MNKFYILILVACVLATGRSYSQENKFNISIHTNLGKSTSSTSSFTENSADIDLKQFAITPRAVYRINKIWAVGALYHYIESDQKTQQIIYVPDGNGIQPVGVNIDGNTINQHAGLLIQSFLYDNGKIAAFLELDGTKGTSKATTNLPDGMLNVTPVVKSDVYSSGMHAGGRYTFFKGLGAEIRLNRLIGYYHSKTKGNDLKKSQFNLFDNFWNEVSLGLSYQF